MEILQAHTSAGGHTEDHTDLLELDNNLDFSLEGTDNDQGVEGLNFDDLFNFPEMNETTSPKTNDAHNQALSPTATSKSSDPRAPQKVFFIMLCEYAAGERCMFLTGTGHFGRTWSTSKSTACGWLFCLDCTGRADAALVLCGVRARYNIVSYCLTGKRLLGEKKRISKVSD